MVSSSPKGPLASNGLLAFSQVILVVRCPDFSFESTPSRASSHPRLPFNFFVVPNYSRFFPFMRVRGFLLPLTRYQSLTPAFLSPPLCSRMSFLFLFSASPSVVSTRMTLSPPWFRSELSTGLRTPYLYFLFCCLTTPHVCDLFHLRCFFTSTTLIPASLAPVCPPV